MCISGCPVSRLHRAPLLLHFANAAPNFKRSAAMPSVQSQQRNAYIPSLGSELASWLPSPAVCLKCYICLSRFDETSVASRGGKASWGFSHAIECFIKALSSFVHWLRCLDKLHYPWALRGALFTFSSSILSVSDPKVDLKVCASSIVEHLKEKSFKGCYVSSCGSP